MYTGTCLGYNHSICLPLDLDNHTYTCYPCSRSTLASSVTSTTQAFIPPALPLESMAVNGMGQIVRIGSMNIRCDVPYTYLSENRRERRKGKLILWANKQALGIM